jgi:lysozyme family protein
MKDNFDKIMTIIFTFEGGYVNDPDDPGGETKYGISKKAFPKEDIKALTKERAKEIYHKLYWDAIKGDDLPDRIDACMMDTAVNTGVGRAVVLAKDSKTVDDYLFNRLAFYLSISKKNPTLKKYLWGWMYRVIALRKLLWET